MSDQATTPLKDIARPEDTGHAAGPSVTKQVLKPPPAETEELVRTVCLDVLDKQYKLYSWNDTKTQALITTNSVLFAAVGFLYKECLRDTLAMILLGIAILLLGSSLITCLIQVIPRLSSGKSGADPNTRSLRGITSHKTWEGYYNAFAASTNCNITTDTIRQVFGMAHNNVRSAKIIRRGVILTASGVAAIFGAVFTSAIAARGHHAFGSWQTEAVVGSTNPGTQQNAAAGTPSKAQASAPTIVNSPAPVVTAPVPPAPAPKASRKKQP